MSDDESDFQEEWDEYEWERFLQQQDRNTEKYLGLLEKFMDHPERDRLIAREMGWQDASGNEDENFVAEMEEEIDTFLDEELTNAAACEAAADDEEDDFDRFSNSPLYQQTMKLNQRIARLLDRQPALEEQPDAIRLAACCATCGAKLAAALCGDDFAEIGMTIAYLKRGLKASNDGLDASSNLAARGFITPRQFTTIQKDLFSLRGAIVTLMGEYRAEWRRRYGAT